MSSVSLPSRPLVVDTVRRHRWGILAWVAGGTVAMVTMGAGLASERDRFPGGAKALAASVLPGAEAMRLLRWPAERLDTLGGYLTYHNVTLFTLALCVYGAVQGVHAVRGVEATGVSAEILATGRSRPGVVLDRSVGFAVTMAAICLGLGAAIAVAMAIGGEPNAGGSFITAFAVGLGALTAYALGMLVSQLTSTPRAGTGISVLLLVGLYLLTNVWDEVGPLGVVRFVSPFYYVNFSRALVPGHGLDVMACLGLVAVTVLMLVAAAQAYQRRDHAAGIWTRHARPAGPVRRVQRPVLASLWSATLLRHRVGLLTWALAAAATLALMGWLEPTVADLLKQFQYLETVIGDTGRSISDQYFAYAGQILAPIVTAYVITQAAGWVGDLQQGRVELLLTAPMSWPRLVWQRMLAVLAGVTVVTAAGIAGLAGAAVAVGAGVDPLGLVRLAADTLLLAAAVTGVAALAVAWLRSNGAVTALAIFAGASYLVFYLVPIFDWPSWVVRISVFGAFGNPYLAVPPWTGLAVLAGLAVLGGPGAAAVARRSPKVAT